jgi:cytochrome c oxidase subunit 1
MSEPLGHLHFWLTLIGAYAVFLPMHLTGLMGEPRHYAQLTGIPGPVLSGSGRALSPAGTLLAQTLPLNRFITYAAIFLASAQLLFLLNLIRSVRKGNFASSNPWRATTLEWHPAMNPFPPSPASDTSGITVHRAPCHYQTTASTDSFLPQWTPDPAAPTIEDTANPKPE